MSLPTPVMRFAARQLRTDQATATTVTSTPSSRYGYNHPNGPAHSQNTTLYLFTFLAAVIVILGAGAALVLRAVITRRRWIRTSTVAIARGEEPPPYTNRFYPRPDIRPPKKTKQLPPMPGVWEAELNLEGYEWEHHNHGVGYTDEEEWSFITPVALNKLHAYEAPRPPTPPPVPVQPPLSQEIKDAFREVFPRLAAPRWVQRRRRRQAAERQLQERLARGEPDAPPRARKPDTKVKPQVVLDTPEIGSDVRIGVLIALPSQAGVEAWQAEDPEEAEVPLVCLGVLECTIDGIESGGSDSGAWDEKLA